MLMLPSNYCVEAQEPGKAYRIGVLISASPMVAPFTDAFREGMRELGYIEGKNYVLEIRARGPKTDQLSNLAAELVANRSGNRNRRSDSGLSEVGAMTLDTKDVAPVG
jgi:putative ABC transport system substrate-binding protein